MHLLPFLFLYFGPLLVFPNLHYLIPTLRQNNRHLPLAEEGPSRYLHLPVASILHRHKAFYRPVKHQILRRCTAEREGQRFGADCVKGYTRRDLD